MVARKIALFVVSLLMVAGCVWGDPIPSAFRVTNNTKQTLLVAPVDAPNEPTRILPGETAQLLPGLKDCSTKSWVATTEAGQVLAQIPGACMDHYWRIRGLNDSSYE